MAFMYSVLQQLFFLYFFLFLFRRAKWLRVLNVKPLVKCLYACSLHFFPEFIFGMRVSNFAIPKCAQLNELPKDETIPSFDKDSELKVGNQGDKILEM